MDIKNFALTAAAFLAMLISAPAFAGGEIFKCKTDQGMKYQKSPCAENEQSVSSFAAPKNTGQPSKRSLTLDQGFGGHYFLASEVNGNPLTFVIDTGATVVSLPESYATKAELKCKQSVAMETANGQTAACVAIIDKLKLGPFTLRDVEAAIVPNLSQPLLGMNVLQRFSITQDNNRMVISE